MFGSCSGMRLVEHLWRVEKAGMAQALSTVDEDGNKVQHA
jgi:hypothetical protein